MMECKVVDTMEETSEVIAHLSVGASPWTGVTLVPDPFAPLPSPSALLRPHTRMCSIRLTVSLNRTRCIKSLFEFFKLT